MTMTAEEYSREFNAMYGDHTPDLPEETAPKGYDESYLNECIAKASKTWKGVDVDKYMDEVRGNRPNSSDSSLEDEMINYWGRIPEDKDLIDTARHFALWQKKQMMNEWLQDRGGCFWDGVEEGKKAMREQMMKDAVEGYITLTLAGVRTVAATIKEEDNIGFDDKIKIIIVKEDKK